MYSCSIVPWKTARVVMVPVVLTELLSDANLPSDVAETISEVPLIEGRIWLLATGGSVAG